MKNEVTERIKLGFGESAEVEQDPSLGHPPHTQQYAVTFFRLELASQVHAFEDLILCAVVHNSHQVFE